MAKMRLSRLCLFGVACDLLGHQLKIIQQEKTEETKGTQQGTGEAQRSSTTKGTKGPQQGTAESMAEK